MPDTFLNLTFYEYLLIYENHKRKLVRHWEHTRFLSYTIYCMNTTEAKKPSLQEYMKLSSDKTEKPEITTKEEREDILRRAQENKALLKSKGTPL